MLPIIDKKAVADSFSKAANHYDQFAELQRDIGDVLFDKLGKVSIDKMVDLGCGTGYYSDKLSHQFPEATIICFDISYAMLEQAKKRNIKNVIYKQGDVDVIPFSHNSIDLIYSNLVIQWSNNFRNCLKQLKNSLKEGGKCYLSTLINGSLNELTQAWKHVDSNPHTNSFISLQDVKDIVNQCNFSSINITTETRVLQYENVIEVMRALKGIGANHVHGYQASQFSGRQILKSLQHGYRPFMNKNGLLNLTYQVCYIEVVK